MARAQYLVRQQEWERDVKRGESRFLSCLEALDDVLHETKDKHTRVRLRQWLDKLSEPVSNPTWKKNRNDFAELLVTQMRTQGVLGEPFIKTPPSGALPTLPGYLKTSSLCLPYTKVAHGGVESCSRQLERTVQALSRQIEVLQQELEQEKALRVKERRRLHELHAAEVEQLKQRHRQELLSLKGRDDVHPNQVDTWLGKSLPKEVLDKAHTKVCINNEHDRDGFLAYLDDFESKALRLASNP